MFDLHRFVSCKKIYLISDSECVLHKNLETVTNRTVVCVS